MKNNEIKNSIKPGLIGLAVGAAAVAIVGFNWGGWVTAGTATTMTEQAMAAQLVPICVGQFQAEDDREAKLAELRAVDSWKRAEYVIGQGWATMPGSTEADNAIARQCASDILS
ncbi:MAG: hypothetical protein WD470_10010 [Rhodospirillaceae bacterium]